VLAAAARLRDEIGRVEQDLSPARLSAAGKGTPLADVPIDELTPDGHLEATPLGGHQVRNLLLMLATRQLVQAVVVGLALFAFFLILGLIVVTPETAEQWIGAPPVPSVLLPTVPVAAAQRHPLRRVRQHVLRDHLDERRRTPTAVLRTDHRRSRAHTRRSRGLPGRARRLPARY
jgi:hypothetical protein